MNKTEYEVLELWRHCHLFIKAYEDKLCEYPPENLIVNRRGERNDYYLSFTADGSRKRQYLALSENKDLIRMLKLKSEFISSNKKEYIVSKDTIQKLKSAVKNILKSVSIEKRPHIYHQSENPFQRSNLTIPTKGGEMVRSKSEALIADTLFDLGIEYQYEKGLDIKPWTIYPDFWVINPLNNRLVFLEHLGNMQSKKYFANWEDRLDNYRKYNYEEGRDLITTIEEEYSNIVPIIKDNFTLERYTKFPES